MSTPSTPEIEVKEHPNFRTIAVGGAYSNYFGMRFEIMVYSEHQDLTKILASTVQQNIPQKFTRTLECRLVIDPFRAKVLVQTLTAQLVEYEKQFGNITSAQEQEQAAETTATKKTSPGIT